MFRPRSLFPFIRPGLIMPSVSSFLPAALVLLLFVLPLPPASAATSEPAPLATSSLLLNMDHAGAAIIAVGERGHVLRSDNHGESWRQILVPTRATLTAVLFIDAEHGWAVGHDQTILQTTDGGNSWRLVYQDLDESPPLLDLYFFNRDKGYAIGAYGTFLETRDGGETWEQRYISEDDFHLNQIRRVGNALFIAGEAGMVYRSTDDGATFTELIPGYAGSFFGLLPLDRDSLLLFGLRGHLFRSDDSGETWRDISVDSIAGLSSGLRLADGTLIVAGLAGTLLVSRDDGQTFVLVEETDRRGFSRLLQTRTGRVLAVGDFGVDILPSDLFN